MTHPSKVRKGERHYRWKGDGASNEAKRMRAQRIYGLGRCERCLRNRATDRHHKDGNPGNNDPSNVEKLCRKCHMTVDGRLARLLVNRYVQPIKPPAPCEVCGNLSKPLRKGRCHRCNEYFRRHGVEWSPEAVALLPPRICTNCGLKTTSPTKGLCRACYEYRRRTGGKTRPVLLPRS